MEKENKEYLYKLVEKIEHQKKSAFKKNVGLSVFVVGLILVFVYISIQFFDKQQSEIKKGEELISVLNNINTEKDSLIGNINETLDFIQKENPGLTTETKSRIELTKNKIEELAPVNQMLYGYTVLRYYKRPFDNPRIDAILNELKMDVNYRPIKDSMNRVQVNSIWFGDSVDVNKVRKLALYFEKEGIVIKGIRKFKGSEGFEWKTKAIELGYDYKLDTLEKLSIPEILELTKEEEKKN